VKLPFTAEFFIKRLDKPMFLDYTDLSEKYKYPENYVGLKGG